MKKQIFNTLLAAFFAIFAITVSAADTSERRAQAQQQIEEIKTRLNLTEEQKARVTPIFEKSMKKRQSILKRYGIDLENREANSGKEIGFRTARKLKKEMEEARAKTLTELQSVLTDVQLTEYKKIQEEMRSQMRSRLMSTR